MSTYVYALVRARARFYKADTTWYNKQVNKFA